MLHFFFISFIIQSARLMVHTVATFNSIKVIIQLFPSYFKSWELCFTFPFRSLCLSLFFINPFEWIYWTKYWRRQHLLLKLHQYLTIHIKSFGFPSQEKPLKWFYLTRLLEFVHASGIKQNIVTFTCSERPVLTFHLSYWLLGEVYVL